MNGRQVRVLFDDQIFLQQRRGGISKAFVELASSLRARGDTSLTLQARVSINEHLREMRGSRLPIPVAPGVTRLTLHTINRVLTPRVPFDLVHHTYYRRRRLADVDTSRSISTVYDMIPEDYPELFPLGNPHDAKLAFLRASAGIVCISNATLERVRTYVDLSRKRVAVVHLGVSPDLRPLSPPLLQLPPRFILHVGRRDGYKRGVVALRAFSMLARQDRTLCLVLVGGGPVTEVERDLLPEMHRVVHLTPTDRQMPGIYSHALALVSASISEGFGMPLLEAMACGCPVVVAANAAHLEVAEGAARFFTVGDVDGCASALIEAVERGDAASERVQLGLKRSKEMTWSNAAAKLREFYEAMLTPE